MSRTWYVDHQSGSVNNAGDSLAITQTGSDATIVGSTLTIAGGGLTGKAGRMIAVNNSGTYRVFLIASVTNDTTATLTALDVLANVAAVAYNIGGAWKGIASATAVRIAAGDTVRCKKSPDPTSLAGNTSTWTLGSKTVALNAAVTAAIDSCDSAWTPGTNVTQAQSTTNFKEGSAAQQFTTAAGFTTGIIASHAITPGDLSGYQQVCFWIRANTTALAAGDLSVRLKHGVTVRQTILLPAVPVTSQWVPVVVDTGLALGSDIDTIDLFANVTQASKVYVIDNVFAAKASSADDSLTLWSLISRSSLAQGTVSSEGWYAIDSITGANIVLRVAQNTNQGTAFAGYPFATAAAVTLYKREPFPTTAVETLPTVNGTSGNYVTLSGGWDTVNMSSQTGETWLNQYQQTGQNVLTLAGNYMAVDRFGTVGGTFGIFIGSTCIYARVTNMTGVCPSSTCVSWSTFAGSAANVDNILAVGGAGGGITMGPGAHRNVGTLRVICTGGAANAGVTLPPNTQVNTIHADGCVGWGVNMGNGSTVYGGSTSRSGVAGIITSLDSNNSCLKNFTIGEATPVTINGALGNYGVSFENYGGVAGDTRFYSDSWLAQTDTTVKHGSTATKSWKLQPTSATVRVAEYSGVLSVGQFAVKSGVTYHITGWFARNNSGITASLVCPHSQLAGISSSDVSTSMSVVPGTVLGATNASPISINQTAHGYVDGDAIVVDGVGGNTNANGSHFAKRVDADNFTLYADSALTTPVAGNSNWTSGGMVCKWEQLTISFTPSEDGVLGIEARAYGGATSAAWVSDLGVS